MNPFPTKIRQNFYCIILVALSLHGATAAQLPAFPGAEGFGAFTTGGRGGDVYCVTNLNTSGPGSFTEALATVPPEGRTIVFGVSGYIPINKARITKSKVTIAGQTAPGDGIGFKGGSLIIAGNDVVIRHARFRYGRQTAGGDCINIERGVTNLMLDHLSLQFSTDENLSSFSKNPRPDLLTFQWSINAWGLETHSAGGLWDVDRVTTHHTLWAHNHTRNPKARPDGLLDWVNNVTFDYDIGFIMGDSASAADWKANVRGNYFIRLSGGENSHALEKARSTPEGKPNFTLHASDNLFDKNGNAILDGKDYGYGIASGDYSNSIAPIAASGGAPVALDSSLLAYKKIASQAGALRLNANSSKPIHDEVDTILMNNLLALKRHHVRHQNETGASNDGFGKLESTAAPTDTDRDGLPDFWETTLGSNPKVTDHNQAVTSDAFVPAGYTRLEEYLHFLATPHTIIPKRAANDSVSMKIDPRKYTRGFITTPVTYSVSNPLHGTAKLGDDSLIHFTPTPGYSGRALFDFTVTDGDGSQWTQRFLILASSATASTTSK